MPNPPHDFVYMFPPAERHLLNEEEIKTLARVMFEKGNSKKDKNKDNSFFSFSNENTEQTPSNRINVGFTYLLQLISHDIVPKTNNQNSRVVTPELNLDSIYGAGPDGFDAELFNENTGEFIHQNASDFDIPRRSDGKPNIPELRNSENAIVAQMHRMWQKLHDKIVINMPVEEDIRTRINEARKCVIAVFHCVLVNDTLKRLLHSKVHPYFFRHFKSFPFPPTKTTTQLPAEFTHAAFRFGHSMVLNDYEVTDGIFKSIGTLMRSAENGPIPTDMEINFPLFFEGAQFASKIDLTIVADMGNIPTDVNIVSKNLQAGHSARLKSGEEIIQLLANSNTQFSEYFQKQLKTWKLIPGGGPENPKELKKILKATKKEKRTPLWLSILRENHAPKDKNATPLGFLGSVIVAEVLRESICAVYGPQNIHFQGAFKEVERLVGEAEEYTGCNLRDMSNLIVCLN